MDRLDVLAEISVISFTRKTISAGNYLERFSNKLGT